jgi:HTH-type transcriptional regulator/antitoxin HigA
MNSWTIIQTSKEYAEVMDRIEKLSQNPPLPKSEEGRELMLLGYLANQYEERTFPITYPDPIEAIKVRMGDLGLTVNDLLKAFGDKGTASKVLRKERALSLNMIRILSDRLSLPTELLIQPLKRRGARSKMAMAKEPSVGYKKASKSRKKRG